MKRKLKKSKLFGNGKDTQPFTCTVELTPATLKNSFDSFDGNKDEASKLLHILVEEFNDDQFIRSWDKNKRCKKMILFMVLLSFYWFNNGTNAIPLVSKAVGR